MTISLESGLDADVSTLDAIFDSNLPSDAKKFWLNVAYDFLDERLDWSQFSTSQKKRMEAIAAADAASSQDPRVKSEGVGDSEYTYQRDPNQTDYWQQLVALDHTGTLQATKDAATVQFESFGPGRD